MKTYNFSNACNATDLENLYQDVVDEVEYEIIIEDDDVSDDDVCSFMSSINAFFFDVNRRFSCVLAWLQYKNVEIAVDFAEVLKKHNRQIDLKDFFIASLNYYQ